MYYPLGDITYVYIDKNRTRSIQTARITNKKKFIDCIDKDIHKYKSKHAPLIIKILNTLSAEKGKG